MTVIKTTDNILNSRKNGYNDQLEYIHDQLLKVGIALQKRLKNGTVSIQKDIDELNKLIQMRLENSDKNIVFNSIKLRQTYHLTDFEFQCLFYLLAAEVDVNSSDVYSQILKDSRKRYPSVSLLLEMLCNSPEERIECMNSFSSSSGFCRKIIRLFSYDGVEETPLLTMGVKLNPKAFKYLLGATDCHTNEDDFSDSDDINLFKVIKPFYKWEDIVLPEEEKEKLLEIISRVKYQDMVYDTLGFSSKFPRGRGITAMFTGLPGTGKTLTAEIIANELGWALKKVDLSQVVSKYIGETEKNLSKVFERLEADKSVLFFDEADALFGKRSDIKDSKDRYANLEVAYLLQKMEEYDGVAILSTNMSDNIDDAFFRRIKISVNFPFPDEKLRYDIWKKVFPVKAPLSTDIDFQWLAQNIRLSGGCIKNIAIGAAFRSCCENCRIKMKHIIRAARMEYAKMKLECDF